MKFIFNPLTFALSNLKNITFYTNLSLSIPPLYFTLLHDFFRKNEQNTEGVSFFITYWFLIGYNFLRALKSLKK